MPATERRTPGVAFSVWMLSGPPIVTPLFFTTTSSTYVEMSGNVAYAIASISAGWSVDAFTGLQSTSPLRMPYLLLGAVLIVAAIVDLLWTTLWVDGGAGPLSARLTTWTWRGFRQLGSDRSRVLSLAGPTIVALTLVMWVGLIWIGWTFLFAGSENALIPARNDVPVTWAGRFYFVGYTMFTMGNGDFYPPAGIWQIAASFTTASGMLFVTMGISYVFSVLGAVSQKRSFASSVTGLGERSETIVKTGWNGEDLTGLHLPLDSLASQLELLAKQHKAYPILHYYHSQQATDASALGVAIFDEALTLIRFGVPEEDRPDAAVVKNARSANQSYLETLHKAFIRPADDVPPSPDLDRLREAGIPTVSDREFEDALDELDERRRKLLGIVTADSWDWPPLEDE